MIGFATRRAAPVLSSSIARKLVISVTGLWLCAFLVVHLAGNLTLFLPTEIARRAYNAYTAFMTTNPVIEVIAWINYAMIVAHCSVALLLTVQNRRAVGVARYVYDRPSATSYWYSRNMGLLGSLVLVFLVIHMASFWYRYRFGAVPLDAHGLRDMYGVVVTAFAQPWYGALYVVAMVVLGFHLLHGFASGFRTLGVHHRRYWRWVRHLGWAFAVIVAVLFAAMPIYVFLAVA